LSRSFSELSSRAEFHQCSAVVVARAIENLVQPLLNPVFDGVKEQRRYDHGEDEAGRTAARNPRLNQLRYSGYDSEINAHNGCGRKRVNDAAFEDEIHIHQAIAENGITKRKR